MRACSRLLRPPRSSAWAATTASTPKSSATKCPPSRSCSSSRHHRCSRPAASCVDFEGELAFVIGRRASRLKLSADWRSFIRGYTLANDVTARDLQKKEGQWTRPKGWDTFCPVGPYISDEVDPETALTLETRVNGEVKQHATTADFIFSIPELLAWITQAITLEPGDLVLTGTPAG